MIGAELGYRYAGSPLIAEESGVPEPAFRTYRPTSWPGARLPHVWLDDGTPIQDRIPPEGYTLLRINAGRGEDADGLARAFSRIGAPFSVCDIASADAPEVYDHNLILLRPDMHVAWRGDTAPGAPDSLAAMAVGLNCNSRE